MTDSGKGAEQTGGVHSDELGEKLYGLNMFGDLAPDVGKSELLNSMLSRCLAQFGCKSGSISLFRPDSEELELVVAEGPMCEAMPGTRQSLGAGIAGTVAERQEGIFVEDIGESDDFGFEAGAIARARALDPPGVHRRLIEAAEDDFVCAGIGVRDVARDLVGQFLRGAK